MEGPRPVVVESHRRNDYDSAQNLVSQDQHPFNGHLQSYSSDGNAPNIYEVKRFKTNPTVWATILSLAIQAVFVATVLQLEWYCNVKHCKLDPSSYVVYFNSGVWLFTLVVHRYIRHQRDCLRRHGYATFYHKTRTCSTLPALAFSTGSVILLVYLTVLHDFGCSEASSGCKMGLTKINWMEILVSLEVLLAFPALFIYLVHSLQFNKRHQTPDIFRESPLDQDNLSIRRDVGYRSQTLVEELLEKQSDAISYLKLRCEHLTRMIFHLTNQRTVFDSSDDLRISFSTSETQPLVL